MKRPLIVRLVAALGLGFGSAAFAAGSFSSVTLKPATTPLLNNAMPVAIVGEDITVTALGNGSCSQIQVNKGEGVAPVTAEPQAYFLPFTAKVNYSTPGMKEVKVTSLAGAGEPCTGAPVAKIFIAANNQFTANSLRWGWSGAPKNHGKVGEMLVATIGGSGYCQNISIDWGDGSKDQVGAQIFYPSQSFETQPGKHAYAQAGTYTIYVRDSGSTHCGEQRITATVLAPPLGPVTGGTPPSNRPPVNTTPPVTRPLVSTTPAVTPTAPVTTTPPKR